MALRNLLILAALSCAAQAQTVKVAPYFDAGAGTQALTTAASTDTAIDWIQIGQTDRMLMPRTDVIRKVRLYIADRSNITALYVGVCHFSTGSTWTVSQWTPALTPIFANEINTYTLATPLSASKYDVMCGRIEWSTPHATNLNSINSVLMPSTSCCSNGNGTSAENCYYQLNQAKPTSLTTSGMTLIANHGCPVIEAWMTRPDVVGFGDSIIQKDDSVADGGTIISWPIGSSSGQTGLSIPKYFAGRFAGMTYQDMGWGGQTTGNILARITHDLLNLKPTYAIVNGGVNDLFLNCANTGCTTPQITTIETNIQNILSAAQAAGIKVFISLIGPWNTPNGTNALMANADTIDANTIAIAPTYGATVIDQRCVIGQNRASGTAGNCWDFQAAYLNGDGLGVHPNAAGDQAIANIASPSFATFQYGGVTKLGGTAVQH